MSMTFAAVICDADDPCSVRAAFEPESSFTASPRSTTRPFCVLELWLQLRVVQVAQLRKSCKMNCCAFLLCLHCDNNFTFDFLLLAVWQVRSFLSLSVDCSFCVRTFHYLEQKKMLVRKSLMTPNIEPLLSNVLFTNSLFCDSPSCAFS